MGIIDFYYKLKIGLRNLISKEKARPKIHKKKLQLQLKDSYTKFQQHLEKLEIFLRQQPDSIIKKSGEQIYDKATSLKDNHLIKTATDRISNQRKSLIHPSDFSIWVLFEINSFTEEIYHYLQFAKIGV